VTEMALPDLRLSVRRPQLPTLVVGGNEDAVFPASMLHFMASTWRAELHRADGAGHMLMLDPQWKSVADHLLGWMKRRIPA
jgi:pimeloyl-ACP methyl ester carboxylesterase